MSFFIALTVCELILAPFRGIYPAYSSLIGYIGLAIEATLPLPQILANRRLRSCKGFRFSVLASWLVGDAMKMGWFFTSPTSIPWAFKLCGIFQAGCDSFLGIQYLMYGSGPGVGVEEKTYPMAEFGNPVLMSGRDTPTGRRTSSAEKRI